MRCGGEEGKNEQAGVAPPLGLLARQVSFTEFLGAALRLRGAAASKDLLACFFTSRRLEGDVASIRDRLLEVPGRAACGGPCKCPPQASADLRVLSATGALRYVQRIRI